MKFMSGIIGCAVMLQAFTAGCSVQTADEQGEEFERIDAVYYETDVNDLIDIDNAGGLAAKRRELVEFIWGPEGFPSKKQPSKVEKEISDDRYAELFKGPLAQIDKITVTMDYGFESIIYHFHPKTGNKQLVIYHQGHMGDFIKGIDTIKAFLKKGYAVMAFSMPLRGPNNYPVVHLERFGRFHITQHEHLKLLDKPISYFLEPIAVALNHAESFKYEHTYMTGISGGGWTTTLYAAIDTRILHSYPVAGSLPIYLRSDSGRDWGDFEQTFPDLYRIANYPELYVMGSYGKDRKQIQILNQYDSCCFAGIKSRTYEKAVKDAVAELGKGEFRVFLDQSHKEHKISTKTLSVIFTEIESKK